VLLVLVVAAAGAAALASNRSDDSNDPPAAATGVEAVAPLTVPAAPDGSTELRSGAWTVTTYTLESDEAGSFGGSAVLRYTGSTPVDELQGFTFTVVKDGTVVATMSGTVLDIEPGGERTARLLSSDPYVDGPHTVLFRADERSASD
jgi:hypothetical protein